ncbi:MAG: preprotein translocase subunit YajC [OCS116 cluster bacterium]|uniref:Sec translocon accessory complex subunit YajC n=1 Tax=OCS116 cluster bacterium TaxID=2030921 RepID=A0A2A4Z4L8_9PROT|nr:preprotein translocase subunit YajC [OCS116 cluster bacterium]
MDSNIIQFMPIIFIFVVMYFLVIRPQQKKAKLHREMIGNVRRGDTIVTSGGLIGKISKVNDDAEVTVELTEGVKVRIVRSMIAEVRVKGEPVADKK